MAILEEQSYSFLHFPLLLAALLVCLLLPTIFLRRRPRLHLPPGPRPLPILGNLLFLGSSPHRSLTDLSKRYGPLMFLRFGSVPIIVASSPATARLILQTHDRIFCGRPQNIVPMNLFDCKDVLFSQPDSYWRLIRQIWATELFRSSRFHVFRPMIAEEVNAMLCAIANAPGKVHMRERLYAATSNIISRMAVGKRLQDVATKSQADPSYNLRNLVLEMIRLFGSFNVADYISWSAWMDLQGFGKDSKAVTLKIRRVWQELIDERRSLQPRPNETHQQQEIDLLDVLLSIAKRGDLQISDTNIMAILSDTYAGGIETTAISVEWAFGELLTNPNILKKVQEELQDVVGNSRLICETDICKLPYLQAVVKETMRLHPVGPLLAAHVASQQCQLFGFDIPINTHAYVNAFAIGRDPTIWEKPLEFCPERFIDSNIDVHGQHFELLPFGSGRRGCPALIMGFSNVHIMLANLLHVFHWTIEYSLNFKENFGIVMTMSEPIIAKASLKVPKTLLGTHV